MKTAFLGVFIGLFVGCSLAPTPEMIEQHIMNVNTTMDDWHQAASDADFERYFNYFENDSSIFMGTDDNERWNVADFKTFSKPYFDRGRAWNFTPKQRHVYISGNGYTAWFDEKLDTPNLGPSRGTGILVLKDNEWKVAHYNLTVPIPNPIMDDVKALIEQELNKEDTN